MTTIVYDHKNKQIACDSRRTNNGIIASDTVIKYLEFNKGLWFLCGNAGDAATFVKRYKELDVAHENLDTGGFLIDEKDVYVVSIDESNIFRSCELNDNFAFGSGGEFALAAVDLGRTAKEAVEYAMTRDCYSGGKVHVYDIEKGEFI